MNKINKKNLTRPKHGSIVKKMHATASPSIKRTQSKSSSKKDPTIEEQYSEFFVPRVSPLWAKDENDFSLEQPSPLKVVPTETSYIVGGIVFH
jgi:hypothetical protein